MPLAFAAHVPERLSLDRILVGPGEWLIGREPECDLPVAHESVSRRHALLIADTDDTWRIRDVGSKNGLRVDGRRVVEHVFERKTRLAIGDVLALAEPVSASEARLRDARARSRRDSITQFQAIGSAAQTTGEALRTILLQLMQIAECERGMLFEVKNGRIVRTLATQGIEADAWSRGGFSGSHGAVDRALADRMPVFLSKAADAAGMAARASVISGGIGALAALPLLQAPDQLIGLCYLDSLDSERSFTELDGELLGAFSGRAATMLALALVDARIEALVKVQSP